MARSELPERDRPSAPPREVGEVVRGLLEGRLRRGVTLGRLVGSWAEVVGERLAAETAPATLEAGELVVGASSSAWAAQVGFLAEEIRRRTNALLGAEEVRRVRVVVARRR